MVERIQGTYLSTLRAATASDVKTWDVRLNSVVYMYNCSVHSSTGHSPYLLMFAREPNLRSTIGLPTPISQTSDDSPDPLEAFSKFRFTVTQNSYLEAKKRQDELSTKRTPEFQIGDKVLIEKSKRSREKLDPLFKGPYEVVNKWDNDNYTLVLCTSKNTQKPRFITTHVRLMRRYKEPDSTTTITEPDQPGINLPEDSTVQPELTTREEITPNTPSSFSTPLIVGKEKKKRKSKIPVRASVRIQEKKARLDKK